MSKDGLEFDFESHGKNSRAKYSRIYSAYDSYSSVIASIISEAVKYEKLLVHSIDHRAKSLDSFENKASKPDEENPEIAKYDDPINQIHDLAGVRVITYFLRTIDEIKEIIEKEFEILEVVDKSTKLKEEGRFGYQSVHFVIKLNDRRLSLPEYTSYSGLICEIQVRTILQHAWAEIEHDIQYKSVLTIPTTIRRRFIALAGMLEIADREFQAIQKEDDKLRNSARASVKKGKFDQIEITSDALKVYLDKKLGTDGRMSSYNYEFVAKMLKEMGFSTFDEVEACISKIDGDTVSRTVHGSRPGQITRFETMLLASMGVNYVKKHPWNKDAWFISSSNEALNKLKQAGIETGSFIPNFTQEE